MPKIKLTLHWEIISYKYIPLALSYQNLSKFPSIRYAKMSQTWKSLIPSRLGIRHSGVWGERLPGPKVTPTGFGPLFFGSDPSSRAKTHKNKYERHWQPKVGWAAPTQLPSWRGKLARVPPPPGSRVPGWRFWESKCENAEFWPLSWPWLTRDLLKN